MGVDERMNADLDAVAQRYRFDTYVVRKKVLKLFGGAFHIYDPEGNVAFYSQQKAFRFKEDIRLFTGEDMQIEVLSIQARQIIDFSAAYNVIDPLANEKVGALRRKGLKSMFKDEWIILDANDQKIGLIREDSARMAFLRRAVELATLLSPQIPQKYRGEINGRTTCHFQQNFNPFVMKVTLDFSPDTDGLLDRRLGIAAAVLLCAIEGKQK